MRVDIGKVRRIGEIAKQTVGEEAQLDGRRQERWEKTETW